MVATADPRANIIALYLQRIARGDRIKLSKSEQEQLVTAFVDDLKQLTDKETIQQRCLAERELLERGYPVNTIVRTRQPLYRNAIKAAIAAGDLVVDEATSLADEEEGRKHYALVFFTYDPETYEDLKRQDAASNNVKQDDLKPVNPEWFLEQARALLESDDPYELAAGIAAVTGRRFSEVVQKGDLVGTKGRYTLKFSGQLKKENPEPYFIPTLLPAHEVLNAIYRLRSHPRIQELEGRTVEEINSRLNKSVNRVVREQFQDTDIVPVLERETAVSIHNLRSVYGEIAIHFFCPPRLSTHRFVQARLGHVIGESELERKKNSGVTEHYFHYYLEDENGKHLGTKGVLLAELERDDLLSETTESLPLALGTVEAAPRAAAESEPTATGQLAPAAPSPTAPEEVRADPPSAPEASPEDLPPAQAYEFDRRNAGQHLRAESSSGEVADPTDARQGTDNSPIETERPVPEAQLDAHQPPAEALRPTAETQEANALDGLDRSASPPPPLQTPAANRPQRRVKPQPPSVKQIRVYERDRSRLQALAERLGCSDDAQPELFAYLLDWTTAQLQPERMNETSADPSPSALTASLEAIARAIEGLGERLNPPQPVEPSMVQTEQQQLEADRQRLSEANRQLEQDNQQLQARQAQLQQEIRASEERLAGLQAAETQIQQHLQELKNLLQGTSVQSDTVLETEIEAEAQENPPSDEPPSAAEAASVQPEQRDIEASKKRAHRVSAAHKRWKPNDKVQWAYQTIRDYNDRPDTPQTQKIALNQQVLITLANCTRSAIHQFLEDHGRELQAHNDRHHLDPDRQNRSLWHKETDLTLLFPRPWDLEGNH